MPDDVIAAVARHRAAARRAPARRSVVLGAVLASTADSGSPALSEMPPRELACRSRLQVALECARSVFVGELDHHHQAPRLVRCRVRRIAGVVGCQASARIRCSSDVILVRVLFAVKEVDQTLRGVHAVCTSKKLHTPLVQANRERARIPLKLPRTRSAWKIADSATAAVRELACQPWLILNARRPAYAKAPGGSLRVIMSEGW